MYRISGICTFPQYRLPLISWGETVFSVSDPHAAAILEKSTCVVRNFILQLLPGVIIFCSMYTL